ncbi:MAG TPA: hypothetical protein VGZ29_14965, partial [Terriglobia bacterium]|nr:hypothetical protein [Terriglobia bacterium]
CATKPPVPFSFRQTIPMGPYQVRVSQTELRAGPLFGGAGDPEINSLIIYLTIDGAESQGDAKNERVAHWLVRQKLLDGQGRRHRGIPMPTRNYFNMAEAAAVRTEHDFENWAFGQTLATGPTREWVLVFPVSQESRDFKLLLRNPDRLNGQPETASVALDR